MAGIFFALIHPRSKTNAFMVLFFAGIMLSIPLVGTDGYQRVKIGSDIFLYMMAAVGMHNVLLKTSLTKPLGSIDVEKPGRTAWMLHPISMILSAMFILLCIPFVIQFACGPAGDTSKLQRIESEDLAKRLNLDEIPLGPKELDSIWHQWPDATFEQWDRRMAYFIIRYSGRDAVYFDIDDGIPIMDRIRAARHWPLFPMNINRTVMILEARYTLFPNVPPGYLNRFENKKILVMGNLMTKRRPFRHATPFVLIASLIISMDESGNLIMAKL